MGLLSVHNDRETFPFSDLLAQSEIAKVETDGNGPGADLVFHIKRSGQTIAYWVSPRYNFLLRKSVWSPGAADRSETEVTLFHELEPGVFFPAHAEVSSITSGVRSIIRTVDYTEVLLNKPHPPGIFALKFPRGAPLFNQTRNQTYKTDEDGKPLGDTMTLPESALLPTSPVDKGPIPALTETKEEPRSWTRFILPASAGVLVLAAIAWVIRRRLRAA